MAAIRTYQFPALSISSSSPSTGLNGAPAPTSSTQVGGVDGNGDLQAISVDTSGVINVNLVTDLVGLATEAKQDDQITELVDIVTNTGAININAGNTVTQLQAANVTLAAIQTSTNRLTVVQLTSFVDASSTNIPASASLPLQLIASTSAIVRKIVSVEDIGEFMGLYTGAAAAEVLVAVMPLGGGEIELNIPAGTRLSIRNMKNAAVTTGNLVLNLLG
jgi:hypothetical protein